jgi:hypothetical protein
MSTAETHVVNRLPLVGSMVLKPLELLRYYFQILGYH